MLSIFAIALATSAPDPIYLYSTRSDNHVRIVAASDLSHRADIPVNLGCHELAVSSDGRWAIGSAYGGPGKGHQPADNRLVVLDLAKNTRHRTIDLGELQRPNDIAFIPGTADAVVTVEVPPHVVRVNAETGEFSAIPIEHKAGHMLALSPDASSVYVSHVMPGLVSVVDLAQKKTVATIPTRPGAEGIACSPDGKHLWVACNRSNSIVIIDTTRREVVQTLDAPGFPFRMRFSPDGKTVAVSFAMAGEIGFYDAAAPTTLTRVSIKDEAIETTLTPTSIAFAPDGTSLSVVCDGPSPQLVRIATDIQRVTDRISTAQTPDALAAVVPALRSTPESGATPVPASP